MEEPVERCRNPPVGLVLSVLQKWYFFQKQELGLISQGASPAAHRPCVAGFGSECQEHVRFWEVCSREESARGSREVLSPSTSTDLLSDCLSLCVLEGAVCNRVMPCVI